MQGIIDPKDVPRLMREGVLEFGMELEFSKNFEHKGQTISAKFSGMLNEMFLFYAYGMFNIRKQARFPLPDLRDGDPVVVKDGTEEHRRLFSHFDDYGINCWLSGLNRWTVQKKQTSVWGNDWRIPTPKELTDAGYPDDYYTKRGIK